MLELIPAATNVVAKYVGPVAENTFPVFRMLKLTRKAVKVCNSTNPVVLAKNITLTVIDCCCPAPLRLAAQCIGLGALIVSTATTCNPFSLGAAIHLMTEIYEKCDND